MAIFTPGPLAGAVSGNLGALNFVAGNRGLYVRPALRRTNPQTSPQLKHRTFLPIATHRWNSFDQDTKQSWATNATLIQFPNRLGIHRNISGFQLWLKFAIPAYQEGATPWFNFGPVVVSDPPADLKLDLNAVGHWSIIIPNVPPLIKPKAFIYLSRPHRNTFQRHYSNFFLFKILTQFNVEQIFYTAPGADPRVSSVQPGEVIAVTVRWRYIPGDRLALLSLPITQHTIVV